MKSIIDGLWDGNLRPQESGIYAAPKFKELNKEMSERSSAFDKILSSE